MAQGNVKVDLLNTEPVKALMLAAMGVIEARNRGDTLLEAGGPVERLEQALKEIYNPVRALEDAPPPAMQAWSIRDTSWREIATAFFPPTMTSEEVMRVLIDKEGYDPTIAVHKA